MMGISDHDVVLVGPSRRKGNRCEIDIEVPDSIRALFNDCIFWYECTGIKEAPESIAIVPAVAMFLPFVWAFDLHLKVRELDRTFCLAIPQIKRGYADMLPNLNLGGYVQVDRMVDNGVNRQAKGEPMLLFSGGVDAWCSFVRHCDEHPRLVTIWGSDIKPDNDSAWNVVYHHTASVAEEYGLSCSGIRSNFKAMLNQRALNEWLAKQGTNYTWWHDLQHGIGLLSLTAPLGFAVDSPHVYIASSFYSGDKGSYTCASDPTIDNLYAVASTVGFHDAYELTRQDKIAVIVSHVMTRQSPVDLRVCFHAQTGRNCCRCEKCGRTILGIYSAGGNPHEFGFPFSSLDLILLSIRMRVFYRMKFAHYRHIQESALVHKENVPLAFKWIYSDNLENICDNEFKRAWERFHNFGAGLYHKLIGK